MPSDDDAKQYFDFLARLGSVDNICYEEMQSSPSLFDPRDIGEKKRALSHDHQKETTNCQDDEAAGSTHCIVCKMDIRKIHRAIVSTSTVEMEFKSVTIFKLDNGFPDAVFLYAHSKLQQNWQRQRPMRNLSLISSIMGVVILPHDIS